MINIKLALFFDNKHCFKNFKYLDNNTPRPFSSLADLTQTSFIWYWNSKFIFPICITPHLFTLKSISHLFAHATYLSTVLYIDIVSLRVFTRLAIFYAINKLGNFTKYLFIYVIIKY